MKDATRVVRAGLPDVAQGQAFLSGPTFAGPYHLAGDPETSAYRYGRYDNPTWSAYEKAIGEVERARSTVVFSSGMAAIAATLGVTLTSGDILAMPSDAYYAGRLLASGFFATLGVEVRLAPTADNAQQHHLRGAKLWLAHRSLATLDLRLQRQCKNALAIAEFLVLRREVRGLRYPGLPSDPAYPIASRQMKLYGPIVSFELASRELAEGFLKSCELVFEASSFGGVHTTAERRARWGGDQVAERFIRMSIGCEDAQDLIADLSQALDIAHR